MVTMAIYPPCALLAAMPIAVLHHHLSPPYGLPSAISSLLRSNWLQIILLIL